MVLKPQDVLVLLSLADDDPTWSYASLAARLDMSPSQVHAAVKRAMYVALMSADRTVNRQALLEFLIHGLKYALGCQRGQLTRGFPTAHAAAPLVELIASDNSAPPVWPDPDGSVRGEAFMPLHKSAVAAARNDPKLYELLALVDAIRGGRARERKLAQQLLRQRLAS